MANLTLIYKKKVCSLSSDPHIQFFKCSRKACALCNVHDKTLSFLRDIFGKISTTLWKTSRRLQILPCLLSQLPKILKRSRNLCDLYWLHQSVQWEVFFWTGLIHISSTENDQSPAIPASISRLHGADAAEFILWYLVSELVSLF